MPMKTIFLIAALMLCANAHAGNWWVEFGAGYQTGLSDPILTNPNIDECRDPGYLGAGYEQETQYKRFKLRAEAGWYHRSKVSCGFPLGVGKSEAQTDDVAFKVRFIF